MPKSVKIMDRETAENIVKAHETIEKLQDYVCDLPNGPLGDVTFGDDCTVYLDKDEIIKIVSTIIEKERKQLEELCQETC